MPHRPHFVAAVILTLAVLVGTGQPVAAQEAAGAARTREADPREPRRAEPAERRTRPEQPPRPEPVLPKPYPYVRAVPNNVPAQAPAAGYPPLVITPPARHPHVIVVAPPEAPPLSQGPPFLAGYILPEAYRHPLYHLHDWQNHPRLYAPPAGYQWVRIGVEVLLVSPTTGYIAQRMVF